MHFFEEDCREFALQKFYDQGFTDDEAVDMVDTPRGYDLYIEYLSMYLCD